MRIWISTAGWRLTRKCAELLLACALLLLLGSGAFAKEKKREEPPDMDMLEFLGTYETDGGKMIDPIKLQESEQEDKSKAKPAPKGATPRKKDRNKKDESDD